MVLRSICNSPSRSFAVSMSGRASKFASIGALWPMANLGVGVAGLLHSAFSFHGRFSDEAKRAAFLFAQSQPNLFQNALGSREGQLLFRGEEKHGGGGSSHLLCF